MKILIDSREQRPYEFTGERYAGTTTESVALSTGDYSVPGFEDRIAVERKTIDDMIGCLKSGKHGSRERFEREIARSRSYEHFFIVLESDVGLIANGSYRSQMKPQSVLQSLFAWMIRYPHLRVIFAGTRQQGEYITFSILKKYAYEIDQRTKIMQREGSYA